MAEHDSTGPTVSPTPNEEQRLKSLEDVCRELELIHSVTVVCSVAAKAQAADHDMEFSLVLRRHVSDPLWQQLLKLTHLIETLGGTTVLSEDPDTNTAGGHS